MRIRPRGHHPIPTFVFLLTLLSLPTLSTPARAQFSTLETDNLRLIYHRPTLGYLAPYSARCFENALRFHTGLFEYNSREKITVFMDDFQDYHNAGVGVAPRNMMILHVAPGNFVYETGPSNERLNQTINHEVLHFVGLDQAAGSERFFRRVFGGKVQPVPESPESIVYGFLTAPRRSSPRWYQEGIAVFMETWMAGGYGRALGAYDEMVFRAMVRDGSHIYDPLGLESEGTRVDFQGGVNSYLYGTRFISYVALRWSPEDVVRWVKRTDGSRQHFAAQFRNVFGMSLDEAWKDWIVFEHGFQQANLDSIRLYATTPHVDVSRRALGSVSRSFYDPDTREIYVALQYPGDVAAIAGISIDTGRIRRIKEVKGPALYFVTSLAYDPATKTAFYTTDNNSWRDLHSVDVRTGNSKKLMKDGRIGDLVFDRTDASLWGVRHYNAKSTLVRLAPPYTEWDQILTWPYGEIIYDLDLSPDGRSMSMALAEINGRQTLRLHAVEDLENQDTTSVTLFDFGAALPGNFVFSGDGRFLYGSSYYTGVSNIFRWNFDADSMEVVSNCETGFFRPLDIGSDSLLVFRYSGEGFVPALIEPRVLHDVSAIHFLGQKIVEEHPVVVSWAVGSPAAMDLDSLHVRDGEYSPMRSLGLDSFYPVVAGYKDKVAYGMRFNVSDPIQMNSARLVAAWAPDPDLPKNERLHLDFEYERYNLTLSARYNAADFYDLFGPTKRSRKGYSAGLGYRRSLIYDAPTHLDFSAGTTWYGDLERLPSAQNVDASFDRLLASHAGLSFKNIRSSMGAVDHEKGYSWKLRATSNYVNRKAYPAFLGTFDVGVPLPGHTSIWLRTGGGYSPGDRDEPFANFYFGGFGNNWVDHAEVRRYREYDSFPGVELNEISGTNFGRALVDLNLPPLRFRRAGRPSLYASWARASVFAGGIVTNLDASSRRTGVANVGTQVDLRVNLLVRNPLTFSFGYARAFEEDVRYRDEFMFSVKIL